MEVSSYILLTIGITESLCKNVYIMYTMTAMNFHLPEYIQNTFRKIDLREHAPMQPLIDGCVHSAQCRGNPDSQCEIKLPQTLKVVTALLLPVYILTLSCYSLPHRLPPLHCSSCTASLLPLHPERKPSNSSLVLLLLFIFSFLSHWYTPH